MKTYLKIFRASSCRCTRIVGASAIAERALPDSWKHFGYLVKSNGKGTLALKHIF